ncbi:uncharacterized protein E5676_scaffold701G00380 [Cucumis melo var. makuwa]|uniref:Uncharacterized protein n=1 Tax=Cucumis melo var. makuwa TaxID=1194695 RepID=A0A5A7ULL0_CUCMM|nr:uncharacterized protein E6C27_scaffold486G00880 [Cucumis melo var. makuwa]TYJ99917.1 uncharacterized protein E5676_scaffold701G00380 [Cucumis melo var. makuwa]
MRNGCEMSTIDHSLTEYETRCDLIDTKNGVRVDDLGFTLVDLNRIGMTREDEEIPYIRVDCEGAWDTFNSRLEDQIFNFDVHRVVEYNELDQSIGESATKLKSFIGTTVRVHVPISYQSWKDVSTELKDKIYELIEMVSNKGHEWRKNNKYNHRMLQKGYANLAEEMSSEGMIHWEGFEGWVNMSHRVNTSTLQERNERRSIKKKIMLKSERARMVARILELEAKLMNHRRVPEVATKGETDESKIKS